MDKMTQPLALDSTTRLLFPAVIQQREFGRSPFNQEILHRIRAMRDDPAISNACQMREIATIGGYQPDLDLNDYYIKDPAWSGFMRRVIHPALQLYMAEHCKIAGWPRRGTKYGFNATWAVLYPPGAYQAPHIHHNTFCVCAYYAKVPNRPQPEGAISFINPHLESTFPYRHSWRYHETIQPQDGSLIIFPGWLQHYSHPHNEGGERLLLTFDVKIFD